MTWHVRRWIKHRWSEPADVRRALGKAALARIEQRVRESERHHSGEIRVCVEAGLPWSYLWRGASARERAIALFGKLRLWDTQANNGVLIYLLYAEHAIEIVADRGLNDKVEPGQWVHLVEDMRSAFRAGQFEQGLLAAIDEVDRVLVDRYPVTPGQANTNELPDQPDLR